jgi:undecaprenyl pyrophosphate phosphatase UppP
MLAQILGAIQGLIEFLSSADSLKHSLYGVQLGKYHSFRLTIHFSWPFSDDLCVLFDKPFKCYFKLNNAGVNTNRLRLQVIIITAVLVGVITALWANSV